MGYVVGSPAFEESPNIKLGLTTGLCGSITSFSAVMVEAFALMRGGFVWNGFALLLMTFALSFCAFFSGEHLASLTPAPSAQFLDDHRSIHYTSFLILFVPLIWCFFNWKLEIPLSLLLAPVGCIARFLLSTLNTTWSTFPLGTFMANLLATTVLSALQVLDNSSIGNPACNWIYALSNGFCGGFSTISTFILELSKLNIFHSYRYGFISIISGQSITFLVFGIYALNHSNSSCRL